MAKCFRSLVFSLLPQMNEIRTNNLPVICNQALINGLWFHSHFSFNNTWYLSHKQIVFVQIKKLNEAFDEFMIDPSSSEPISQRRYHAKLPD